MSQWPGSAFSTDDEVVVVIGDLHAGGTTAVSPPEYVGVDGNLVQQSALQRILWRWWRDATGPWLATALDGREYTLVLNGDLVEGCHHRTKQVMDGDEATHADAAVRLLEPLAAKATDVHVIRGTEAHVGTSREHSIGLRLGASYSHFDGKRAHTSVDLDVCGCLCNFTHHITGTMREHLSSGRLSIAAGTRTLGRVWSGMRVPRVWCSGHAHHYDMWSNGSAMTVSGPAWQLPTLFTHKVVPEAKLEVGLYLLDFAGCDRGDLPAVRPRLYHPEGSDDETTGGGNGADRRAAGRKRGKGVKGRPRRRP